MTPTPAVQERLRQYLLGQLADDACEEFEKELMASDELFEELLVVEDEIIDGYLGDGLSNSERAAFEKHFLATSERQDKLKFGRAFKRVLSSQATSVPRRKTSTSPASWAWTRARFSSPLQIGLVAIIVIGVALGVWRVFFYQSDIDKGLLALNAAYREQRPVESRISDFNYAPYVTTRGPGDEKIDRNELALAELTLRAELKKNARPSVRQALGKVFLAKKDFDAAIEQFDEALKGDPKNAQIYSDLGAAWLEKGKVDLIGRDLGKGMEELGHSLKNLNRALELDPNLLEARFNRALCRQYLTLPDAAEDWREYLKKDSTSPWAEEARRKLQLIEDQQKKVSRTKAELLQDFLSAAKSRDAEAAWAALNPNRSRAGNAIVEALLDDYLNLSAGGRIDEAQVVLEHLSFAGELELQKVGDRYSSDVARFYRSAGSADRKALVNARGLMRAASEQYNRGEFDKAAELYSQAKLSFEAVDNESETLLAESWIGYCRLRTLSGPKTIQLFSQLEQTCENRRYLSLASQALQALADEEFNRNEYSKSLALTNRAQKLSEDIKDGSTTVHCLVQSLSTYLALGDYRRSLDFFIRAKALSETLPADPKLIWPAYYEAALDFHFLGLRDSAFAFAHETLALANTARVPLLRSRSLERLGLLHSEQKEYDQALQYGEQALAEAEQITSERAKTNMRAHSLLRMGRIASQAGRWGQSLDYFGRSLGLYETLKQNPYLYEAHKGRLIADIKLNDDVAASAELPIVVDLFEDHREKITEESRRDRFFDAGQDTYDIAIDFAFKNQGAEQAFAYAEKSRARSLFEIMSVGKRVAGEEGAPEVHLGAESKPLTPSDIRAAMSEKTQLLVYSIVEDRVLIWVVKESGIESGVSRIDATDMETAAQNFSTALFRSGDKDRDSITQQAKVLYGLLIIPIEKYLDRNRLVVVVPDKSLNYLPFEALVSPDSGRYLIDDFTLQRAPSATVFIESSKRAKALEHVTNERLLSVGNPNFNRGEFATLPDLPAAAREATEIAKLYRSETHLIGDAATARSLERELPLAQVIHLATHAVADERSPLLSRLLLTPEQSPAERETDDGVLRTAAIYETDLSRTRLAVLSACRTGIERTYGGEGAIGLARPFIAAGVPVVVASLWPVESETTTNLMISFHKHRMKDGDHVSTVAALRRAQLEMIHNPQPNSVASFGWAAFVAIGGYAEF